MAVNDESGVEDVKRGRGRPKKKGETRKITHSFRFDEEEDAMLNHLEVESDDSKSEIIRKALRTYYRIQAKKW